MTDDQVLNVKPGDYIDHHSHGSVHNLEVMSVRLAGRCDNKLSGAFGHAYACLTVRYTSADLVVGMSIYSDEYIEGDGGPPHDVYRTRRRGWVLTGHKAVA